MTVIKGDVTYILAQHSSSSYVELGVWFVVSSTSHVWDVDSPVFILSLQSASSAKHHLIQEKLMFPSDSFKVQLLQSHCVKMDEFARIFEN